MNNDVIIEPPDKVSVGDELYCWLPNTGDRLCNGTCVAFEEGCLHESVLDSCKLLNSIRQLAGSVAAISRMWKLSANRMEKRDLKDRIDGIGKPPEVR